MVSYAMNPPAPGDILDTLEIVLRQGRQISHPLSGLSMGVQFAATDGVVIQYEDASKLRPGMIIVYRRGDRWIVHRIVWVFGKGAGSLCVTKGDSVNWLDRPFVSRNEYVGLVIGSQIGDSTRLFTGLDRVRGRWIAACGLLKIAVFTVLRRLVPDLAAGRDRTG